MSVINRNHHLSHADNCFYLRYNCKPIFSPGVRVLFRSTVNLSVSNVQAYFSHYSSICILAGFNLHSKAEPELVPDVEVNFIDETFFSLVSTKTLALCDIVYNINLSLCSSVVHSQWCPLILFCWLYYRVQLKQNEIICDSQGTNLHNDYIVFRGKHYLHFVTESSLFTWNLIQLKFYQPLCPFNYRLTATIL